MKTPFLIGALIAALALGACHKRDEVSTDATTAKQAYGAAAASAEAVLVKGAPDALPVDPEALKALPPQPSASYGTDGSPTLPASSAASTSTGASAMPAPASGFSAPSGPEGRSAPSSRSTR